MAFSEVYVDPSIAADSGTGTIGDPYGDLEYAIEQTTFDTTNGTRVNIKAGTDEVLASELSVAMADTVTTPAWSTSGNKIFQGYTSVAGDGGIGGISGGGLVSIFNDAAFDQVFFVDMHLHNTGSNIIVNANDSGGCIRCELDNSTAAAITMDNHFIVHDCYIHNVGGGISGFEADVRGNYIELADGASLACIGAFTGAPSVIENNICIAGSTSNGISVRGGNSVRNNSIYSNGGTGIGLQLTGSGTVWQMEGNLIEGFSGVGGVGVNLTDVDFALIKYRANAVYDCTTAYDTGIDEFFIPEADNETLTASPFTDAAAGDFSPVDTGNVKEGSLPNVIGGGFV